MNVNVIDNQLLESLNNYFNTLSKTGYIKNSNSEALLILSFLQEITSDYTDLVTFLNSLSENYCIIPFLDLSTCKIDLNSSDQLVRFTANLDNVSAYINTSYLNNQLINFPYMAITGKSIQINDILAPYSPEFSSTVGSYSIPSHESGYYIYNMVLDGYMFSTDFHNITKYPLTTSIDHEISEHSIDISIRTLPSYNLYAIVDQNILITGNRQRIITLKGYSASQGSVQFGDDAYTLSTHPTPIVKSESFADRYMYLEKVYLGAYTLPFIASGSALDNDLHIAFTSSSEIKNDILISSLYEYSGKYDLSLFSTNSYKEEYPVFLYGLNISGGEELELAEGRLYDFNKVVSSNDNWAILEHNRSISANSFKVYSGGGLTSFTPYHCEDGNYSPSISTLVFEWNQVSNIALATNFIIPTTREDGSAETLLEDGLSIIDVSHLAPMTYIIADTFSEFGLKSKPLLLWSGKAFIDTAISISFSSPEGTTLNITTALIDGYESLGDSDKLTVGIENNLDGTSTVNILCNQKTHFFSKAFLKIGGHIQYNTTTVNITGNISGMSVNIEGEGTVSLPASITVNKP